MLNVDESTSWAVSYSDMLMVLMSFFIIFFSYDESKRETGLSQISTDLSGRLAKAGSPESLATEEADSESDDTGDEGSEGINPQLSSMDLALKQNAVTSKFAIHNDALTIQLSDGLYEARAFDLNDKARTELKKILDVLKPYNKKLRIVFIGHADSATFTRGNKYLGNNFDLSALRASRAMALGVQLGFDISFMAIEAEGSNLRNSRTLSLKIIPLSGPMK